MKTTSKFLFVLVTAPNLKTARALSRAALKAKLIACANLIPKVESHYWWQGKIEHGGEVLMLLKTTAMRIVALERFILANHPYDTPEFIVLRVNGGNERYLQWLAAAVLNRSAGLPTRRVRGVVDRAGSETGAP